MERNNQNCSSEVKAGGEREKQVAMSRIVDFYRQQWDPQFSKTKKEREEMLPDPALRTLSRNLQEFRFEAGLRQKDVGRKIGVSESMVSLWESGKRCPNLDCLVALADLFGVTLDTLVTGRKHYKVKVLVTGSTTLDVYVKNEKEAKDAADRKFGTSQLPTT